MMRMTKTIDHAQLMVKRDAWSYFVLDLEHTYEQQKCLVTWSLNTGTQLSNWGLSSAIQNRPSCRYPMRLLFVFPRASERRVLPKETGTNISTHLHV